MWLLPLSLVLCSAGLHATWNLIVKREEDKLLSTWLTSLTPAVLLAPALFITGLPAPEAWPFLLCSVVIHALYNVALARAYEHGDLSVVYPIARGLSPTLVALFAPLLLHERITPVAGIGVLLVSGGIVWLGLSARRSAAGVRAVAWAVTTAVLIASYSMTDKAGVSRANPLAYIILLLGLSGILMAPGVLWGPRIRRLRGLPLRRWALLVTGGVLSLAAYLLVLVAMRLTQVSYIAALRESSVILAAFLGWRVLGESLGLQRLLAAVTVTVGLLLLVVAMRG
jgi:drug/metabolite transporter (DMT)-like permease